MAFYMDSTRIPPERLVDRPPQQYDRILQTYDIDGARSKVKNFQPESHNWSLKTDDIQGAKPKKKIRNIWGKYQYNPTDKQLSQKEDLIAQSQLVQNPAGVPPGQQFEHGKKHYGQNDSMLGLNSSSVQNQKILDKQSLNPQRRHIEPQSQIQAENVMRPNETLQPHYDYDKVVQPYQKPIRDQQILEKHQQQQQNQGPKNGDIHNKQEQYKQTQDLQRQFDGNKLNEQNQYENNKEAFYRGYTPNQESQKQYNQTQNILEQKANQLSQQAQLAQKNILGNNQSTLPDQQQYEKPPSQQQYQQQYDKPPSQQQQQYQQQYDKPPSQQQYQQQYNKPPSQQQMNQQYNYQQPPQYQDNQNQNQGQGIQLDSQSQVYNNNRPPSNRRQMVGSQSVNGIPPQSWQNHRYNLVGGYIEDDRKYHRDQSSKLEKNYYQNYNPQKAEDLRRTQAIRNPPFNSSHVPQVKIDTKNLDHNDLQYVQEVEKKLNQQQNDIKFGRSKLFDEFQMKPNIASHQRQFIGNTIYQDNQVTKPQRYGPSAMGNFSNNVLDN